MNNQRGLKMWSEIALFPLSQVVLPQGQMQLRVFEARYIRLVKEACAGIRPFASALLNPYVAQQHPDRIFKVATLVKVTDFQQLEDGLLGITITGTERVLIQQRFQEPDGLHVAKVSTLPVWPELPFQHRDSLIAAELQTVFRQNPQLAALYPEPAWHCSNWLAQRWLEILNMQPPLKYQLMAAEDASPTLEALHQWLEPCAEDYTANNKGA
ncbi:LON peptidase substrate-binding domain-containing protein [Rheinheimera sp. 4Y26]|uniref:LON peptidase substrate-binding domain-containing protein n=1 Tax=Rheinheimera sp. 4Y26 TaxID=2977811 RepID=UPI0021B0C3C3|nr:LON peptidase substrate-binding domain-containing protein [Rheinheimera sp. 4Y26]MCT6699597.1 LON peptidase substrate-binding domain-containing protein [Rheinheimera sp. 4Y26]